MKKKFFILMPMLAVIVIYSGFGKKENQVENKTLSDIDEPQSSAYKSQQAKSNNFFISNTKENNLPQKEVMKDTNDKKIESLSHLSDHEIKNSIKSIDHEIATKDLISKVNSKNNSTQEVMLLKKLLKKRDSLFYELIKRAI